MANMENDYLRARLSENLWEEGGGADPKERHSYMFQQFLTESLGIDIQEVKYEAYTKDFVRRYFVNEQSYERALINQLYGKCSNLALSRSQS